MAPPRATHPAGTAPHAHLTRALGPWDLAAIGINQTENGSPLPALFTYHNQQTQCTLQQDFVVPQTEAYKFAEKLFLAVRADIRDIAGGEPEEAWTNCFPFPAEDGTGYCNYAIRFDSPKSISMAVGFEVLMMTDNNDFDYNDWLTDLNGTIDTCRTLSGNLGLYSVEFNVAPEARGGALDHVFHLSFPANTFLSDGVSTLSIWVQNPPPPNFSGTVIPHNPICSMTVWSRACSFSSRPPAEKYFISSGLASSSTNRRSISRNIIASEEN